MDRDVATLIAGLPGQGDALRHDAENAASLLLEGSSACEFTGALVTLARIK